MLSFSANDGDVSSDPARLESQRPDDSVLQLAKQRSVQFALQNPNTCYLSKRSHSRGFQADFNTIIVETLSQYFTRRSSGPALARESLRTHHHGGPRALCILEGRRDGIFLRVPIPTGRRSLEQDHSRLAS